MIHTLRNSFLLPALFYCFAGQAQMQADSLRRDSVKTRQLEDVTITSDRITDRSSVSDLSLDPKAIYASQGLYEDPLRSISFFPGVSKGNGDLFSPAQIYVRGGNPEENLYMFNNVRIYFPWYFGGIKSVFNTETIDNLELLTGGFSAKYGNAMSSILNVTTRQGNYERYHGNVSIGFANSQFLVEGPLVKNKVSFLVSARRTYLDLVIKDDTLFPINNFTDMTYVLSWKVNDKHRILLNGVSGVNGTSYHVSAPEPGVPGTINNNGTLHSQSLQWQGLCGSKLYSKLSLIHSYASSDVEVGRNLQLDISGENTGLRQDFSWYFKPDFKLIFGGEWMQGNFRSKGNTPLDPFELDPTDTNIVLRPFNVDVTGHTNGAYTSLLGRLGRFYFNAGLRYDYDQGSSLLNASPRVSASCNVTSKTMLRAAWGYYYQFPGEEALRNNSKLQSPRCTHYILGMSHNFKNNVSGWIEAYYKQYDALVVYDAQANYSNKGSGYSKGIELFISKRAGSFKGWISYAYSISKRREALQQNEAYFAFDQRHILNNVMELSINNREKFYIPQLLSLTFTMRTGTPYTPVDSAVLTPAGWRQAKGDPFSVRNPVFHNLTLKVQFRAWLNKKKTLRLYSFIEIWNVYNRRNVAGRIYQYGNQYPGRVREQVYYATPFLQAGGIKLEF